MKVIKETHEIYGIPLNMFFLESKKNCPLIFFVHGYFNDKEEGSTLAKVLAKKGYMVICIDAYMHGKRLNPKLKSRNEEDFLKDMFEIVERTAKDIDVLINYFEDDSRVNPNKIGLSGISMGGFTTFYQLTKQPKIKVAVPIIASPSMVDFWEDYVSFFPNETIKALLKEKDTKEFREYLEHIDPMLHLEMIRPIPLLIINGIKDSNVPYLYSQRFYEAMLSKYENKDLLKFKLVEAGHEWTVDMFKDVVNWFVDHL